VAYKVKIKYECPEKGRETLGSAEEITGGNYVSDNRKYKHVILRQLE
jgi:hypothetical protein